MNNYVKVHQPLNVDLRTQKTQTKLYTVLERFYVEGRTFESISIKDLCEQARVSRATFYRHHEEIIQVIEVQI
ncbi:TetR/AcrR family transcriptional regulator, partial [Listeria monocytogenes]|nr:TetR/AcrR family transcriptional regulator [Listeria monocytogenes]